MTASIKMYQGSIFFIFHQQLPNKMLPEVRFKYSKKIFQFYGGCKCSLNKPVIKFERKANLKILKQDSGKNCV